MGSKKSYVYSCKEGLDVLRHNEGHLLLTANNFGNGRAVYMAGLPYNCDNARLLYRTIVWISKKEHLFKIWHSTNPNTDCAAFSEAERFIVVNNSPDQQQTVVHNDRNEAMSVLLEPYQLQWFQTVLK